MYKLNSLCGSWRVEYRLASQVSERELRTGCKVKYALQSFGLSVCPQQIIEARNRPRRKEMSVARGSTESQQGI